MTPDEMTESVLRDGYMVQWTSVRDSAMHLHPRAWTVGRAYAHPELLISGLSMSSSHMVLDAFAAIDLDTPLQVDQQMGGMWIVEAEPVVATGALAKYPTTRLKVYQLVWASPIDGLDPDRDQTVYARGATILSDPYGDKS